MAIFTLPCYNKVKNGRCKMKYLNMQDYFLNQARKEKIPLTIYLINGFQFRGLVKGFDNFTVNLVDTDGRQNIVYKHAVSTIIPSKMIQIADNKENSYEEAESEESDS